MTATDLDLDALLDALTARAIERAEGRPLINEAGLEVSAFAAGGRLIVHPGDTILSSWGNATYDQTVQTYSSTADRDAQWPTPKDGAVCVTLDTNTVWIRQSGLWVNVWTGTRPPSAPRGTLAQAAAVANSASTTTSVAWVTAPAVTVDGTRRVRVSFTGLLNPGTAADQSALQVADGATILQIAQKLPSSTVGSQGRQTVTSFWQGVPAAGPHTYVLQVAHQSGTGPTTGVATNVQPAVLLVEDIGT